MILHLDGSRLGNAAAHLGLPLAALTSDVGVDLLSLGGTKNGLLGAEAIVVLRPDRAPGLGYLRKTGLQLASKMRFTSAQLLALYSGDLWHRSASRANAMASRLRAGLEKLAEADRNGALGIGFPVPTESNAVFTTLSPAAKERARARFRFGDWPGDARLVRLMCAFDTAEDDVDALLEAIGSAARD